MLQGFIFGPTLLKISLNDLLLILSNTEIESYADVNTIGDSGKDVKTPCLVYIFLAGKWIQHMCRSVISLHSCNKSHSYAYREFFFLPEKCKQGKGLIRTYYFLIEFLGETL